MSDRNDLPADAPGNYSDTPLFFQGAQHLRHSLCPGSGRAQRRFEQSERRKTKIQDFLLLQVHSLQFRNTDTSVNAIAMSFYCLFALRLTTSICLDSVNLVRAVRNFESPEMRQAFREGRNVHVKGSSAAMRIYRPKSSEYGLQIPASIEAMIRESDEELQSHEPFYDSLDVYDSSSNQPTYEYVQGSMPPIVISPSGEQSPYSKQIGDGRSQIASVHRNKKYSAS